MNPIITFIVQNWKLFIYFALALVLAGFLVIREIKLVSEGKDGKIEDIDFESRDTYDNLCVPITGTSCSK